MKLGNIYLVSLASTHGDKQLGSHSDLGVSTSVCNEATKMLGILPIPSGGEVAYKLGFGVPVTGIKVKAK